MFTDTHTHPYYNDDAANFVERAIAAQVDRMIMPNVDMASLEPMKTLASKFPDNLRMAIGLHPTEVKENAEQVVDQLMHEFDSNPVYVAIGEVGMDLYWDKTFREKQMSVFDRQLFEAEKRGLPVIIHCREALDETLEVLDGHKNIHVVFHSFGGSTSDVERILKGGDDRYFGINGIVTFKNSKLKETLPAIPKERLMLETDSPYLAPVPYRGKPNESAYIPHIAAKIGETLNLTIEEIASLTAENSKRLFSF